MCAYKKKKNGSPFRQKAFSYFDVELFCSRKEKKKMIGSIVPVSLRVNAPLNMLGIVLLGFYEIV